MDECIHRGVAPVTECPCPCGPSKGACRELPYRGLWGKDRYSKNNVKMPNKRISLSKGDTLKNVKGIRLPDFSTENDSISGFLSRTQRSLRF